MIPEFSNVSLTTMSLSLYVGVCLCFVLFLIEVSTLYQQESSMQSPCDICKQSDRPLIIAAQQGHTDCLDALVKEGVLVQDKSEAFCDALLLKSLECAEFLWNIGIDVNFRCLYCGPPLLGAAYADQRSFMQKLIAAGASVNNVSTDGSVALNFARSKECTELLIHEGADVNLKDHYGETPLHYAVQHASTDCSVSLILAGADVNARCGKGETPLMKAASIGNLQILELLLEKGTDVNAFDSLGKNALYHVVFRGKNMQ